MARIVIVDENDEIIGSQEKSDVTPQDIGRVTGLWITNSKGQVLLSKRKMNKKFSPGRWDIAVAGTVEEGETYDSNIYKEATEELGVKAVKFEPLQKFRISSSHEYFDRIYKVNLDWELSDFIPSEEEFDEIKWVKFDELIRDVKANPQKYTRAVSIIISNIK